MGFFLFLLFCKQNISEIQMQPQQEYIAKVQFTKGEVYLEREGSKQKLSINQFLKISDIVLTNSDSTADIILKNRGIIRIGENTKIQIQSLTEENIEIHQDSGTMITHLKKLKSNENYSIVTPTSVAAVRGTSFITMIEDNTNTKVALVEGKIEVKNKQGKSIVLEQPGEINIQKEKDLTKEKIKPLSKKSLELIKQLAAQDTGNVQEYTSFVQELKNSSVYKELEIESNYTTEIENATLKHERKVEIASSGEETVIKRNIKKDPLKIPAQKDFTKE